MQEVYLTAKPIAYVHPKNLRFERTAQLAAGSFETKVDELRIGRMKNEMTTTESMKTAIRTAVESEVNEKIAAGERLQEALSHQAELAAALAKAQAQVTEARKAAQRAGWSETQLRSLGLLGSGAPRRKRGAPGAPKVSSNDGSPL